MMTMIDDDDTVSGVCCWLSANRNRGDGKTLRPRTEPDAVHVHPSVCDEVHKCDGESSSPHWIAFDVAEPPLLVLLAVHHDHLTLRERQLVGVVRYAVIDGLDSLRPLFRVGLPRHGGWRQGLTYGVLGASWHFLSWSLHRFCSIQRPSGEAFVVACRGFGRPCPGPRWSLTRFGL